MDERIESYFEQTMKEAEKQRFEEEMSQSPALLDDIAFYLKVRVGVEQAVRNVELERKHQEWTKIPADQEADSRLYLRIGIAATFIIVAAALFFAIQKKDTLPQQAATYLGQNLRALPVQLDDHANQLQTAIADYNQADYEAALKSARNYLKVRPNDPEGLKIRGLANLKLQRYDEAIADFRQTGNQKQLYQNPGKFYEALAYLMRNRNDDESKAEKLLEEVVRENQTGKTTAIEWLDKKQ